MTLNQITEFLSSRHFAIVGVSANQNKFGNTIYKELKKKGFVLFPVNPNMDKYDGEPCYKSLTDLPEDVDALIVVTKPAASEALVKEAIGRGIRQIFLQQGAHNEDAVKYAEENGANVISNKCILMYANPKGVHKFHQVVAKWLGLYV